MDHQLSYLMHAVPEDWNWAADGSHEAGTRVLERRRAGWLPSRDHKNRTRAHMVLYCSVATTIRTKASWVPVIRAGLLGVQPVRK
jgi:hypothetical protein